MNLLLVLSMLLADPPPETVHPRRTLISFDEIVLTGEVVHPSTTLVTIRRRSRFAPLVRARGDFRPELLASVDNL